MRTHSGGGISIAESGAPHACRHTTQEPIMQQPIHRIAHDDTLRHALLAWAACGTACVLLFPALRESSPLLGWLPFWLVVAPALDLALVYRKRLTAMPRAFLVRVRRRHRPAPQARRQMRHRRARLRPLLAALLSR
jgi:hypothetical protein